jgi:hypothetical protein
MRKKKVNPRPNWRCRREEYLRATGRRDQLIREGYEAASQSPLWTVLPGRRRGNPEQQMGSIGLCLVKGANA